MGLTPKSQPHLVDGVPVGCPYPHKKFTFTLKRCPCTVPNCAPMRRVRVDFKGLHVVKKDDG